jgi:hypothetical protein
MVEAIAGRAVCRESRIFLLPSDIVEMSRAFFGSLISVTKEDL